MNPTSRTVWIATEIYYPEETSTGYLLTKLAEGLGAQDRVAVLCAQPSYERRAARVPYRERVNGVDIVRVAHPRLNRNSLIGRAINVLTVALGVFSKALREFRRGDVVIVVTNPPMLPFAIYAAAALHRVSVVLLVHDLYPEAAILAGVLSPNGAMTRLWRRASDWLFRRVARIVVLGRDAAELIATRMPDGAARIRVITNWADVDEIRPGLPADNALLRSLGLTDRFVLGYAGNMGRVHDIELLVDAARAFRVSAPDVHLLFIGSGLKAGLVAAAGAAPASNVTLVGPRERSEQDVFLNACHISVMALAPGMAGVGVPSRLYNVLAAGRPVVAAVDPESEPARVLREYHIGIQTRPGHLDEFVRAIESMRADPSFLSEAGSRARTVAVDHFAFSQTLEAYRRLVAELVGEPEIE
jgi:colanic acid biosynthesis glycosyl transferase WcaI